MKFNSNEEVLSDQRGNIKTYCKGYEENPNYYVSSSNNSVFVNSTSFFPSKRIEEEVQIQRSVKIKEEKKKKAEKRRLCRRRYIRHESSESSESSSDDDDDNDSDSEKSDEKTIKNEKRDGNERYFSVKVSNLSSKSDKKVLSDIFGVVGNLKNLEIKKDSSNKFYAIVKYASEESAKKAILKFRDRKINGERIEISSYKEENEVIIENLPETTGIEKMKNILSVVGEITSIVIEKSKNKDKTKRAIVVFKEREGVKNAINILSGCFIDGNEIHLIVNDNDNVIAPSPSDKSPEICSTPLLSPCPPPPSVINKEKEKESKKLFANELCNPIYTIKTPLIIKNLTKKEIEDVLMNYKMKSITSLKDENAYEIIFENDKLANQAYSELSFKEYNDKIISIEFGRRRREKRNLNTVFVGCLSEISTEEDLIDVFNNVGEIESLKIFRQKNRNKPDYAYVNFKDASSVDKAVRMCNGLCVNGRFITVQYPKKKN